MPERRIGVEGSATVPADVGRAEQGPELAERLLPLVGEGDVGGRAAEVVLVLVVVVGHDLVLLKVLADSMRRSSDLMLRSSQVPASVACAAGGYSLLREYKLRFHTFSE